MNSRGPIDTFLTKPTIYGLLNRDHGGSLQNADVAELADALGSGPSGSNPLEVQVLSSVLFVGGSRCAPKAEVLPSLC